MLFETPVLVSDCTPQLELIEETGGGMVFRNKDVGDLTEKIIYLYQHPEERKRMGENGKKAVLEKYNSVVAGNTLNTIY